MEKQYLPLERERDFSQKINDTFQFIRLNFKDLSIALLLIVGPFLLISGIAGGLNQINFINSVGPAQEPLKPDASFEDILMKFSTQSRHSIGPVYYVFLLSYVLSMILLVVTVYGYMQCYLEDAASRITIERVTAKIKAHFIPVLNGLFLVLSIFFGILMLISLAFGALRVAMGDASGVVMALCIMGAFGVIIYFMIMFLLSPAIIIFEGASAGFSLRRAKYLIQGKWWSTFGLIMAISFIMYFIGLIFSLPAGILMLLKLLHLQTEIANDTLVVITTAISTLGTTLLSATTYIALGLQYFNLIEKKDGNSLFKQINNLGNHSN